MLPKMHPAKFYSANAGPRQNFDCWSAFKNGYFIIGTLKFNHENTKFKKHENFIVFPFSLFRAFVVN